MAVNVQQVTRQAIGAGRFAVEIYATRAQNIYHGLIKGDPLSQLHLAVGRADPHAVYERMRGLGPVLPTRLGMSARRVTRCANRFCVAGRSV